MATAVSAGDVGDGEAVSVLLKEAMGLVDSASGDEPVEDATPKRVASSTTALIKPRAPSS